MSLITKSGTLLALAGVLVCVMPTNAQEKEKAKKKTGKEQIIIRRNADTDEKTTIVIDGEKITVNGKPIDEWKDDDVRVFRSEEHGANVLIPRSSQMPRRSWNYISDDNRGRRVYTYLGVSTTKAENGVRITDVRDESPADKAGLKEDDVITKVDTKSIDEPETLTQTIRERKPQDEVEVSYLRDGKANKVKIKLGENKTSNVFTFSTPGPDVFMNNLHGDVFVHRGPRLGARIQDTEEGNGVKVLDVTDESAADKAGLKKDDIITSIDGNKVSNSDDVREKLGDMKDKSSYQFGILRNGSNLTLNVKIPKKLKTTSL